jgi:hypothetical protein
VCVQMFGQECDTLPCTKPHHQFIHIHRAFEDPAMQDHCQLT